MRHAILPTTAAIILMITGCKSEADSKPESSPKPKIVKEKWHWDQQAKQDETAGYAQVVKVGNTIYISGVPTNDISYEAISRLYQALEKSLNAYGATSHNVVKETLYTTDIEEMKKHNEARREFYKGDFPAATWVQISRLYEAEAKVEVDLVAVILDDNQKGNK
ncbi:MAG: RidA family protein [Chitinophagaceae bacterium]